MTLRSRKLLTAVNLVPVPTVETCGVSPELMSLFDACIAFDEPVPGVGRLTHVKALDPSAIPKPIVFETAELEVAP